MMFFPFRCCADGAGLGFGPRRRRRAGSARRGRTRRGRSRDGDIELEDVMHALPDLERDGDAGPPRKRGILRGIVGQPLVGADLDQQRRRAGQIADITAGSGSDAATPPRYLGHSPADSRSLGAFATNLRPWCASDVLRRSDIAQNANR